MPKISIAMTTYNGESFVEVQLQSILDQKLQPDEVVICDDCSTDNTKGIVDNFIAKNNLDHWQFHVNSRNIGFVENFYQAIKRTTGDIIFLCDQDDIWHTDKIEVIIGLFKKNECIKALNTSFKKINADGRPLDSKVLFNRSNHNIIKGRMKRGKIKKFGFEYIVFRNISPGCTAAFRKECKALFLNNFSRLSPHDWELNVFGAVLNGLYFYNEELIDYRLHEHNAIGLLQTTLAQRLAEEKEYAQWINKAKDDDDRANAYLNSEWKDLLDCKQKKVLVRFKRLTAARRRFVLKRSFTDWICAVLNLRGYMMFRGINGIVEDFSYIVKR